MRRYLFFVLVAWFASSALGIATAALFNVEGFGPGLLLGLAYGCVCQALVWKVARP